MATNAPGSIARVDPRNVSNTIRWTFNGGDANQTTGIQIGVLPQGAYIMGTWWDISVLPTGGPTFGVGTNTPTDSNIIPAATVTTGLGSFQGVVAQWGRVHAAAGDVPIFAKFSAAWAAGKMDMVIEFEGGFPG